MTIVKTDNTMPTLAEVSIHDNRFENKHFFPTLDNDFGLLWVMKNGFKIPDVAYDLILAEDYYLEDSTKNPEYEICVKNNGDINFVVLNIIYFEKFSNDLGPYDCESLSISNLKILNEKQLVAFAWGSFYSMSIW